MRDSLRYRIFIHAAALVVSLIILAPFAWLLIASLSSQADLLKVPLSWIPGHLVLHPLLADLHLPERDDLRQLPGRRWSTA